MSILFLCPQLFLAVNFSLKNRKSSGQKQGLSNGIRLFFIETLYEFLYKLIMLKLQHQEKASIEITSLFFEELLVDI